MLMQRRRRVRAYTPLQSACRLGIIILIMCFGFFSVTWMNSKIGYCFFPLAVVSYFVLAPFRLKDEEDDEGPTYY